MKVVFEKKIWFEARAKLMRLYSNLSNADFQFREGGELRMMERIRIKTQLSKNQFYKMIKLIPDYEMAYEDDNQSTHK